MIDIVIFMGFYVFYIKIFKTKLWWTTFTYFIQNTSYTDPHEENVNIPCRESKWAELKHVTDLFSEQRNNGNDVAQNNDDIIAIIHWDVACVLYHYNVTSFERQKKTQPSILAIPNHSFPLDLSK